MKSKKEKEKPVKSTFADRMASSQPEKLKFIKLTDDKDK